jgi:uroporphyrinogen-III synthase
VLRSIPGAMAAKRIAPDDAEDQESGSEAFWDALTRSGLQARRVLLLRAESGRPWLAERLIAAGAKVAALAVYSRRPRVANEDQLATLKHWFESARDPAVLVTSSEAIEVLFEQVGRLGRDGASAIDWLRGGLALATHPRIVARLRAMGFDRVALVAPQAGSIVAALHAQVESR